MGVLNQIMGIEGAFPTLFAMGVVAKATVLVAAAGLACLLLARASAATRHMVWVSAICGALLLPALAAATPWSWQVLPSTAPMAEMAVAPEAASTPWTVTRVATASPATSEPSAGPLRETQQHKASGSVATPATLDAARAATALPDRAGLAFLLWMAVAGLLLAHTLAGHLTLAVLARGADAVNELHPLGIVAARASEVGAERHVRLLRSSRISMPLTWGLRRPVIILPEESREWSRERMRLVLEHELAHVWRFDALSHGIARVACVMYWFNPLVWMAAARLRAEGERASDDWVLRRGAVASDYAGHLLDMATHMNRGAVPVGAVPLAQRSQFEGRVIAILEPSVNRRRLGGRGTLGLATVVSGLVFLLTVAAPTQASAGHAESAKTLIPTVAALSPVEIPALALEAYAPHEVASAEPVRSRQIALPGGSPSQAMPRLRSQERGPGSVEALSRTLLNDESPEVRRTAAWALGEIESRAATPALTRALRADSSAEVREMAARALGEIEDPAAIDALADALDDESANVREAALRALAELEAEEAVQPLMRALRSADADMRRQAAWGLGEIESEEAVPALVAAMDDPDPDVRLMAMWALGEIESEASVPALVRALGDSEAEVRSKAIWALGEIESRAAVAALAEVLTSDASAEVRRQAAWALGEIESEEAVPALAIAMEDSDSEVRSTAMWALGEIESEAAVPALAYALDDPDVEVRSKAAWALGEIESPAGVDALAVALMRDSSAEVRRQAAWALGEIESEEAVPALAAAMDDFDVEVRMMAMWALGEIESDAAVPALVRALDDSEAEVRLKATWALGEIESRAAVAALSDVVTLDSNAEVRGQAAWALGEIESEEAVPALIEALGDEQAEVRRMAAWALGEIEPSSSAIIELLQDPDPQVREAAVRAMSGAKEEGSRSRRTIRRQFDSDGT